MTIYAIGDIHGQIDMLHHALDLIQTDGGTHAQIVYVGDFTDRGPNSKAVLDVLINAQQQGRPWHFIKGNHDRMFHDYVRSGVEHDPHVKSNISWVNPRLGGVTTLASYGILGAPHFTHPEGGLERLSHYETNGETIPPQDIIARAQSLVPSAHLDFLSNLPLTFETPELLFVHAGIRPGVSLADQDPEDLIWIRDGWLDDTRDHGKLVVHGHTALDHPVHHGNRVNIDGGAGYGRPLVPVVFEGRDCWALTDAGRVPMRP